MKKLLLLILPILFISSVKAETIIYPYSSNSTYLVPQLSQTDMTNLYNFINTKPSNYANYYVTYTGNNNLNTYELYVYFLNSYDFEYNFIAPSYDNPSIVLTIPASSYLRYSYDFSAGTFTSINVGEGRPQVLAYGSDNNDTYVSFWYYDSNFDVIAPSVGLNITGFYDYSDTIIIEPNGVFPKLRYLLDYTSWSDYESSVGYSTVNLDNYDYVILSLRDYNVSDSFQTNLQVKGQIGITPVYNYGRTTKDEITGVQVQDRCNISYSDFTSYPFYILDSDIQNNSVYYVKSCASGSSFKYDTSIFDITYVNSSNIEDPVITINGKTYHTIPYSDLPSSATENEANNYIPGQSGSASDTGGLDSAIKTAQNRLSEVWDTFTYFISLVNQLFSALPSEVSAILISAFAIAIVLGLIKIFVN